MNILSYFIDKLNRLKKIFKLEKSLNFVYSWQEAEKIFNQRDDKVEVENNRLNRKPDAENEEEDLEVEEVDSDEWDEDDDDLVMDLFYCQFYPESWNTMV